VQVLQALHFFAQVLSPGITSVPYSKLDMSFLFWYGTGTCTRSMPSFVNRTGHKYGKLTVIGLDNEKSIKKRKYWICACECGNQKSVLADNLQAGKTKSCGCLQNANRVEQANKRKKWGSELYPTRHIWKLMLRRCYNPKDSCYEYYGKRGIFVCKEWHEFDNFLKDMGVKPEGLTLERKDVNKNYSAENCCWATPKEQARNRRTTRWITIENVTKSAAEWCELYKCSQVLFAARVTRGWDVVKALQTPARAISQDWRKNSF
jgi:hypothetical protein